MKGVGFTAGNLTPAPEGVRLSDTHRAGRTKELAWNTPNFHRIAVGKFSCPIVFNDTARTTCAMGAAGLLPRA